jgi:hypothetical protein
MRDLQHRRPRVSQHPDVPEPIILRVIIAERIADHRAKALRAGSPALIPSSRPKIVNSSTPAESVRRSSLSCGAGRRGARRPSLPLCPSELSQLSRINRRNCGRL